MILLLKKHPQPFSYYHTTQNKQQHGLNPPQHHFAPHQYQSIALPQHP